MKLWPCSLCVALLWLCGLPAGAQFAGGQNSGAVKTSLVADSTAIAPGKPFTVGVRFKIKPTWYIYWRNVGDIGMPTSITWKLPAGFKAGPLQWPLPVLHVGAGDFVSYAYEQDVLLFAEITPPAELPPGPLKIEAEVKWQMCDPTSCVPGEVRLPLALPAGTPQPANTELFAKWRAQLPKESGLPFEVKWERDATAVKVHVTGLPKVSKAEFFPLLPSPEVKAGHVQTSEVAEDGARTFTVPIEEGGAPELAWEGVIVTAKGDAAREGWLVRSGGATALTANDGKAAKLASFGLFGALWAAFLGGLILNLMPCVLPVIALKIFGFVRQAGEEPKRVFHLGLAFAAGVLVFFLALAALAIGLRSAGHGFFWGMQFSDPRLLIALISLVVLFALSMFGAFEITLGGSAENTLGTLTQREGYGGAFVHGLFTTLLGTSCTAPFVGPVLGFAVTQPPFAIVAIFITMAIGMSLPYVLLTWHPAWMRFLPQPGAWMERFKQLMGFVLLAVAVWLLGVVGSTRGSAAMTSTAWFLVLLALAGWIFGAGGRRWWAILLALLVAGIGGKVFLPAAMTKAATASRELKPNGVGIVWQPFSAERIEEARKVGPVFIDFTAEWCPNCKANERFVINTEPVAAAFKQKGVQTFIADWTDFDPAITKWIKSFQRIGVPVYVMYSPGSPEPIIFPEILTQSLLLRHLAELPG